MKNRKTELTALLFVVGLVLAPMIQATPSPDGGPTDQVANDSPRPDHPIVTIHSTGNVMQGQTGSFVVEATYGPLNVNFTVSGSAVAGVDYIPLGQGWSFSCSVGQSGYGIILIQTLPDRRASSSLQARDVVVTLEPGPAYFLGIPSSATMWIKP